MDRNSPEWTHLATLATRIAEQSLIDLFKTDETRAQNFSLTAGELDFDFSKHFINREALTALTALADSAELRQSIEALFAGMPLNKTEGRAAHHVALRVPPSQRLPEVAKTLKQMQQISDKVRNKQWLGFTGEAITDVVHIGIGGSHLGPEMVVTALKPYAGDVHLHFVANIDNAAITETLHALNPATTLFIVASKTFTTQETLVNATAAKAWLQAAGCVETQMAQHFIALTAAHDFAIGFGVSPDNILALWDWVGGRYSLWSAIGLPIAIAIGYQAFEDLLAGAHAIDTHFQSTPWHKNIPVVMALLGVWYQAFFDAHSHAVVPYAQQLRYFVPYLQQLDMESNGKQCRLSDNQVVSGSTGPIVWGDVGTNSQHAFHQLLHQGTHFVPVDFILPTQSCYENKHVSHHYLVSHCLAQAQALMLGREHLKDKHRHIPGNRVSSILSFNRLTPKTLGALIACYEHKVFTQAVIWDINPFDQFGVELGKVLSGQIQKALAGDEAAIAALDPSTQQLVKRLQPKTETA